MREQHYLVSPGKTSFVDDAFNSRAVFCCDVSACDCELVCTVDRLRKRSLTEVAVPLADRSGTDLLEPVFGCLVKAPQCCCEFSWCCWDAGCESKALCDADSCCCFFASYSSRGAVGVIESHDVVLADGDTIFIISSSPVWPWSDCNLVSVSISSLTSSSSATDRVDSSKACTNCDLYAYEKKSAVVFVV